jgi:hypothetical protein
VQGTFTLTELRDVQVNRRSYRELTLEASGKSFEPSTAIFDVPGFLARKRPDLSARLRTSSGEDFRVIETTIGGSALPRRGRCELTLEVGWSSSVQQPASERFPFSRDLARIERSVSSRAAEPEPARWID